MGVTANVVMTGKTCAKRNFVDHTTTDQTSILQFIEEFFSDGERRADVFQILLLSSAILTYASAVRDAQHVNQAIPGLGCHTSRCSSGSQSLESNHRGPGPVGTSLAVHASDTSAAKSPVSVRVP